MTGSVWGTPVRTYLPGRLGLQLVWASRGCPPYPRAASASVMAEGQTQGTDHESVTSWINSSRRMVVYGKSPRNPCHSLYRQYLRHNQRGCSRLTRPSSLEIHAGGLLNTFRIQASRVGVGRNPAPNQRRRGHRLEGGTGRTPLRSAGGIWIRVLHQLFC